MLLRITSVPSGSGIFKFGPLSRGASDEVLRSSSVWGMESGGSVEETGFVRRIEFGAARSNLLKNSELICGAVTLSPSSLACVSSNCSSRLARSEASIPEARGGRVEGSEIPNAASGVISFTGVVAGVGGSYGRDGGLLADMTLPCFVKSRVFGNRFCSSAGTRLWLLHFGAVLDLVMLPSSEIC